MNIGGAFFIIPFLGLAVKVVIAVLVIMALIKYLKS